MDDAFGPLLGIAVFLFVAAAVIYIIQLIILAGLVAVPVGLLGREFTRQIRQRYAITPVSGLVLAVVGLASLSLAYLLLKWAGDYHGQWAVLLAVPIFLCLASATLGFWGTLKISQLLLTVSRAERLVTLSEYEVRRKEEAIQRVSAEIQAIQTHASQVWQRRDDLQQALEDLCTAPGIDPRVRILRKERLQNRLAALNLSELSERGQRLRRASRPSVSTRLEILLIDIALLHRSSSLKLSRLEEQQERLRGLQAEKQDFLRLHQEALQHLAQARQALAAARAQRIVLD